MTGLVVDLGFGMPAGGTSAMPVSPATPAPEDPRIVALLTQLVGIVNQMIASLSAQRGAGMVQGGGAGAVASNELSAMDAIAGAFSIGGDDVPVTVMPTAVSAPATASGSPSGGGVAGPVVDMRRVSGTPQPGGVVELLLQRASVNAMPARSEGTWIVLTDSSGTRMQVHVHGSYATQPNLVADAVQRGQLAVHLHEDGTIHLHDVA